MLSFMHLTVLVVIVALLVAALVLCWRSTRLDDATKVIWTLLIVFIPVLGPLVFLVVELLARATRRRA